MQLSLGKQYGRIEGSCLCTFFCCLGSVARITDQHLKAADIDSDDLKLRYVMKKDPSSGRLQLTKIDNLVQISVKGPVKSFTQVDINKGEQVS